MINKFKEWYIDSYANQNVLIISGLLLIIFLAISLAISPTVNLAMRNMELNAQLNSNINSVELNSLHSQSAYYDQFLYPASQNEFMSDLLNDITLSTENHGSELMSFSIVNDTQGENWHKRIYQIDLTGSFIEIVASVDQLQKELNGGTLNSFELEMKKDRVSRKLYLNSSIYIESISYEDI